MKARRTLRQSVFSFVSNLAVVLFLLTSLVPLQPAFAQSEDGLKRQFNAENRKLSFIGPASGRVLPAAKALGTSVRPQDSALALAKRFAPEFGLKNPGRDLVVMKDHQTPDGRRVVRYQQEYQGIPVMSGELIVNTDEQGDLYSMNGEVSADLSLITQPTIDSAQAKATALRSVAKWYQKTAEDFIATEPALWIFDESLLQSSTRPSELVWRMEVKPKDSAMPVNELVLVNAQRGSISLHFNQIDAGWTTSTSQNVVSKSISNPSKTSLVSSAYQAPVSVTAVNWYVATTGDDAHSCTSSAAPCKTINGAIDKPGVAAGDTIKVETGTYTGSGAQVVQLHKDVILSGGWNSSFTSQAGQSTIDGQNARLGVWAGSDTSGVHFSNLVLDHLIIQNGNGYPHGGGAYVHDADIKIQHSVIRNSVAGTDGGGVSTFWVNLTVTDSTISGNKIASSTGTGGGIHISVGSSLTIKNSTINGNIADIGGGINLDTTPGPGGNSATLSNVTLSGNQARVGAGLFGSSGNVALNNVTVTENVATNYYQDSTGAGLENSGDGSNFTIENSIIAGNTANSAPDCVGTFTSHGHNLIGVTNGCTIVAASGDQFGVFGSPVNAKLGNLLNNAGETFTQALLTGSPAIDAGNSATCALTDQRGVSRPVGAACDIGAFEGSVSQTVTIIVKTYVAGNSQGDQSDLPGNFICDQTDPTCAAGDSHARGAHQYAIGVYNLYKNKHNRNGIDQNNMPMISTVHYGVDYANAFWNGAQMVYGDAYGFPLADDVVAHELTHGVTQYESNLFYYYQSGAINESFSDLWGEYYDQVGNVTAGDTASLRWRLGEDISGLTNSAPFPTLGIRDMKDPTLFQDPDRMGSPNYYTASDDNGGVHYNSGVNNKAVFLMVDGDTFNTKTVTGIGWDKVAAIYYEVNTNLLTSGADYSDLYYALQQACSNLIGQKNITSGNCTQVKNAIDAVEMNSQPVPNFNTDVPLCDAGQSANIVFADDLENGTSNWTFAATDFNPRWQLDSPDGQYAQSGLHSLYAADRPDIVTDATARLVAINVPANAYLHFEQSYGFEGFADLYYFDGGVLEYSLNNGSTWTDAGSLIDYNGYKGTIFTGASNPLSGRSAFVGDSHGYISTRLNLSSLAGKSVTFRWRMGLDEAASSQGWWVDNLKMYYCGAPTIFTDVPNTYWAWDYIERLYKDGITNGCNTSPRMYCPTATVTRDQIAVFLLRGKHGSNYAPPSATGMFQDVPLNYWAASWIEQLALEGITSGCSVSPKLYCPTTAVTRDQMAVFLLRAKHGSGYVPPTATGIFQDVPTNYWAADWIEELANEGVTSGCGSGNYCPTSPVTRDQMAVFLVKNFNLP